MAARRRYEGHVWLKSLEGDPADGRLPGSVGQRYGIAQAISMLGDRYNMLVEVELRDGMYAVRCLPHRGMPNNISLRAGGSYTGTNLISILNRALADFTALEESPKGAVLSPREVVRLVVP